MKRQTLPPATPDRIEAIAKAADTLEILIELFKLTGQETKNPAGWLAAMAYAQIEEIRSAIQ